MRRRVYELARELRVTPDDVLAQLSEMGIEAAEDSFVEDSTAVSVRQFFGKPDLSRPAQASRVRPSTWNAGAVRPSNHPDTLSNLARLKHTFAVVEDHQAILAHLGSQFVYSSVGKIPRFGECAYALVRFSGAIEAAFGLTREVFFFYSPHRDLQIRTFQAAKQALARLQREREVTPDMLFLWSPDVRLREKLDDWSSGNFLAIPLALPDDWNSIAFIELLRDYIFSRDLFYETTPVQGDRFFGRRRLLQTLRDDIRNQRVAGLFGLRKAGKTSVLSELSKTLSDSKTIFILREP